MVRPRLTRLTLSAAACWLALIGCRQTGPSDARQSVTDNVRIVSAEKPASGSGTVALRVRYRDHEEPFVVRQDYAFLIDWDPFPVRRRFYVYDAPRGRVMITSDFDAFLSCIRALPTSSRVAWLNTCCAPISYGMTDEDNSRLDAAMEEGKRTYVPADDENGESNYLIVCTCESIGLRFPGE